MEQPFYISKTQEWRMHGEFFRLICMPVAAMAGGAMLLLSQTAYSSEMRTGQPEAATRALRSLVQTQP